MKKNETFTHYCESKNAVDGWTFVGPNEWSKVELSSYLNLLRCKRFQRVLRVNDENSIT
jgi:hypothetical protein